MEYIQKEVVVLEYLKERLTIAHQEEIMHALCCGFGLLAMHIFDLNANQVETLIQHQDQLS